MQPDILYTRAKGGILTHFIRSLDQTVTSETLDVAILMETLYHRVAL